MTIDFWQSFLDQNGPLRQKNPVMHSILNQLAPVEILDNQITLATENQGVASYAQKRLIEIESLLFEHTGKKTNITITLQKKERTLRSTPLLQYEPTVDDIALRVGLHPKHSLNNFAVSGSNQVAYAAAQAVADNPSRAYNPLFLHGGVGVGKTHLAQAVGRVLLEKDITSRIFFSPGDQFTNELIESIRERTTNKFRRKYRYLSLLIIDDVQFIAGKTTVQEEFFHTFNSIVSSGGQIILTSDRPPHEIKNLEDRLRSRFSGGLIVDIQPPDFELRSAILLIKAKEKNIELDSPVAQVIAQQIADSRALEGTLLSIYARALHTGGRIDLDAVESFFHTRKQETPRRRKSPGEVMRVVCLYFDIKLSHLKSPHRSDHVALARQVAMYLMREELGLKHQEIAYILKRRDHTTVIHGVDKVNKLMIKNANFKAEIDTITQSLRSST